MSNSIIYIPGFESAGFNSAGFNSAMTRLRVDRSRPPELPPTEAGRELNVHVIFTDVPGTQASLKIACEFAAGLGARVTILAAQVVPYSLPLDRPNVPLEFSRRALHQLEPVCGVRTSVRFCLCRDQMETFREMLCPESVVVIGVRRGWPKHWLKYWLGTKEQVLARKLRQSGFQVIAADVDNVRARSRRLMLDRTPLNQIPLNQTPQIAGEGL